MSEINNINGFINSKTYNYSAPINFNVGNGVLGSYDNITFKTGCKESWKAPPCNPPHTGDKVFVPQGTPLPLKNEMIFSELPKESMFVFSKSVASPLCNSEFSTDRGLVCTTPSIRQFIGETRGMNKTYENYNF